MRRMRLVGDAFYSAIRANDLARLQAMLKAGADPTSAILAAARRR